MSMTPLSETANEAAADEDAFRRYFETRYMPQIVWYDGKANLNHRNFLLMQGAIIVGAAVTPVLTSSLGQELRWIATSVSTIVAVLIGLLNLLRYQEKWLRHRTFGELLKREQHYFIHGIGEYADRSAQERRRLFVQRVEETVAAEQSQWVEATKKTKGDVEVSPNH